MGYSPDGNDVSRGHVRIRYRGTTSEDVEEFMCAAVTVIFRVCKPVRLLQSRVVCVSGHQTKPRLQSLIHETIRTHTNIEAYLYKQRLLLLFLVGLSPLGTAATTGLLYQPQMMVIVEQLVE
jgi:hypothetical protein